MKKELIGWLDIRFEETGLYATKKQLEWGNPYLNKKLLNDELEEFHEKKVRITIEVIE